MNLTDLIQVRDRVQELSREHRMLAQPSGSVASTAYANDVGCTTLMVSIQRNLTIAN